MALVRMTNTAAPPIGTPRPDVAVDVVEVPGHVADEVRAGKHPGYEDYVETLSVDSAPKMRKRDETIPIITVAVALGSETVNVTQMQMAMALDGNNHDERGGRLVEKVRQAVLELIQDYGDVHARAG